jgi:hypothetical protein
MKKLVAFVLLALLVVISVAVSSPTFASAIPGEKPVDMADLAGTSTLTPIEDAFVRKDYPTTNYGTFGEVRAQSNPLMIGYVKFNVQGLSGTVTKAALRFFAATDLSGGYKVYRTGSGWSEGAINYDNSPALGAVIGASGAVTAKTWSTVDVTAYVTGNGTYSFGVTDPSATMLRLGSRESPHPPQLLIQTSGSAPVATPTKQPVATATKQPAATPTKLPGATATLPASGGLLWSANMETGDLSQWNNGGGEFNSGTYSTGASRDVAHSGAYSAKLTITTPPETGVRLFRWQESDKYPSLYYSTWFYFPQHVAVTNYWNIMQWKSKTTSTNDPFYTLNVLNSGSAMQLYLYDWQRKVSFKQSAVSLPVGKWVHIEGFYTCAADNTGSVTIWQDGQKILSDSGKSTRYSNGDCQWSTNNYSDGLSPSPATIYVDDAGISQSFIP